MEISTRALRRGAEARGSQGPRRPGLCQQVTVWDKPRAGVPLGGITGPWYVGTSDTLSCDKLKTTASWHPRGLQPQSRAG